MNPSIIEINPTELSPELMSDLDTLLPADDSELAKVRFVKGVGYPISQQDQESFVNLSHTIIGWRIRDYENKLVWRFGVISNAESAVIGKGSQGVVTRLAGTIVKTGDQQFEFRTHNKRVAKERLLTNQNAVESFVLEAQLSREIPALHAKSEMMFGAEPALDGYLVLAELLGEELFDVIYRDIETPFLKADQLFKITRSLLYTLQHTLDRKVIHRDFKPENIMIELGSFESHLIDFGLGRYADKPDKKYCGTPSTAAPEMLLGNSDDIDHRADLYSLGLTLNLLWGGGYRLKEEDANLSAFSGDTRYLPNFEEYGLTLGERAGMRLFVNNLIQYLPEDRPSLIESIEQFEGIYLNFLLRTEYAVKTNEEKQVIKKSYNQGLLLGKQLHSIQHSSQSDAYVDMLKAVESSLDDLSDDPVCVSMFKNAARVKLFYDAETKQAINQRAQEIVLGMKHYLAMFESEDEYINKQIEDLELFTPTDEIKAAVAEAKQCSAQLRHMHHKAAKPIREFTFDDMAEVHAKFKKFTVNIKERLVKLNESLNQLTNNRYPHEFGLFAPLALPKVAEQVELLSVQPRQ